MDKDYCIETAKGEIGKRVIVSIRTIFADKDDEFSGYWGVINAVYDDHLSVQVEGGSDEAFEMLPPDLSMLEEAKHEFYEFNDGTVVTDVDYEVSLMGANSPELLDTEIAKQRISTLMGDKDTIAFELIEIEDGIVWMDFYLENRKLTINSNGHALHMFIQGIERELELLQKHDLTLKDSYKILNLPDLYELKESDVNIHFDSFHLRCFNYDYSDRFGNFYGYQYIDDIIIFGKRKDDDDLIYCKISKADYRDLMQRLLAELVEADPSCRLYH